MFDQLMRSTKKPVNWKKVIRISLLVAVDILLINTAAFLALLLRFGFIISEAVGSGFVRSIVIYALPNTLFTLLVLWALKVYDSLWEFAGVYESVRIAICAILSAFLLYVGMRIAGLPIPRSYPVIYGLLLGLFVVTLRFSYRLLRRWKANFSINKHRKRTMLIGAGNAGAMVLKEFSFSDKSENNVVCIIDDDPMKIGKALSGIPIVGDRTAIPDAVKKYNVQEIVLAIPTLPKQEEKRILQICQGTDCRLKTFPALYQLINAKVSIEQLRDVDIEDLLGRATVKVNMDDICSYIEGKVVLVTGGGGSIGSELCRQIAKSRGGRLIIFDVYENNAYNIQNELKSLYPDLDLVVLIGSIRDRNRVFDIVSAYRPHLIYHAAAHKHVPLMEDSPAEAIKNNVFGTLNVAHAAQACGVQRFIMLSTDKAINPTNIMGASKRICEMIIQMMHRSSNTEFVAVRFGNVLGSNGSVIPLFRKQILDGGPVTVTDKNIIRYFMTIPEAVQLVLQAGAYAKGGEIFVLDMGEPVKIDDLARNLIRLSGLRPDVDIEVKYTGLRPGEKLFEEILMAEEGMQKTDNDLIFIGHEIDFDIESFQRDLDELEQLVSKEHSDHGRSVRALVHKIVPTYRETLN